MLNFQKELPNLQRTKKQKNQLSEDQRQQIKFVFSLFEIKKDEKGNQEPQIATKDLKDVFKIFGFNQSQEQLKHSMLEFDLEQRGTIKFKNFMNRLKLKMKKNLNQDSEQKTSRLFGFFEDQNGKITLQSLKSVAVELQQDLNDEDLRAMLLYAQPKKLNKSRKTTKQVRHKQAQDQKLQQIEVDRTMFQTNILPLIKSNH